jgi:hypothetical protein
MAGKLITLPLRVTFGSARLLTRAATGAAGQALSLAGRTIGAVTPGRSGPERPRESTFRPQTERYDAAPPRPEPTRPARPAPAVRQPAPERPTDRQPPPERPAVRQPPPEAPTVREPVHVSEQPELVREFAEPGAEEGAGAAISVMEPWNGYAQMNARDVIARARGANRAELAAVRLYESRHRSRQTVLAAVDRQLRLDNGGAPA